MRNNELESWKADDCDKFDQLKECIKKDFTRFRVGDVAQDRWTLFFWVDGDPDPLWVHANLLQELSHRFSWILLRQIRIVDGAIDIFWSKDVNIIIRLVRKCEFDQCVAEFAWDLIAVDF